MKYDYKGLWASEQKNRWVSGAGDTPSTRTRTIAVLRKRYQGQKYAKRNNLKTQTDKKMKRPK